MRVKIEKESLHFIIRKVEGQRPLEVSRAVKKILRIISIKDRTVVDMMNRKMKSHKIMNSIRWIQNNNLKLTKQTRITYKL